MSHQVVFYGESIKGKLFLYEFKILANFHSQFGSNFNFLRSIVRAQALTKVQYHLNGVQTMAEANAKMVINKWS